MPYVVSTRFRHWALTLLLQVYNGLGLLLVSLHPRFSTHRFAGPAIFGGALTFSGSIFGLVLGGDSFKFLGPVTPMGGLALIAGSVSLSAVAFISVSY
jgi:uncharacterized membrane protein YgdD (TMEM256/DUF423 family)